MASKGKVWVIEADPRPRRKTPPTPKGHPAVPPGKKNAAPLAAAKSGSTQSQTTEAKASVQPAQRLAVAYLLGNLGPYLLPRGDRNPVWAGIGVAALVLWVVHLGQWNTLSGWLASGSLPFAVWFFLLLGMSVLGLVAGARAIFREGSDAPFVVSRLPVGLRHPKAIGLLGFFVPGSGLLCTGHPWKAALAYLNAGLTALACLTLLHWNELWVIHQQSSGAGLAPATFERIFVLCLALFLAGSFVWVYNAFEGARHASRLQDRVNTLGPWWVLPAFAVQLFLLSSFDAGARARDLDRLAAELAQQGYTYVPYHIERLALRLDPSNVEYLVHAASLADALGQGEKGRFLRLQAATNWERATQVIDVMHPDPLAAARPHGVVEDTRPPVPPRRSAPSPVPPLFAGDTVPPQQAAAQEQESVVVFDEERAADADSTATAAPTDSTTKKP